MEIIKQLLAEIEQGKIKTKEQLIKRKRQLISLYKTSLPKNAEIYAAASPEIKNKIRLLLQTKPVRTISGVAVVAVMTPPHKCPHGRCAYCPKGKDAPQSYTGLEPAARRAIQNAFDPYRQVQQRLQQLLRTGHNPQKIELIIMGGTFPARPKEEQKMFIKGCFAAMNDFPRVRQWAKRDFDEELSNNETSDYRCIGMTLETRPDCITEKDAEFMLSLGCTRVELGVQTVYDYIYKNVNRGHTVQDVINATRILKDKGFKILYHMMPGLPGTTFERDVEMFHTIFSDENFMPDMLKIYPTLVIKGTEIYKMWKSNIYTPIDERYMLRLLEKVKPALPEWVRIMRIERDIPGTEIEAGIKSTNLRQMASMRSITCHCIRCREVGHVQQMKGKLEQSMVHLSIQSYKASGGKEYFIQFKDINNTLYGFLRLRINNTPIAYIRELHVYGQQTPIGEKGSVQHKGLGQKLLRAAEIITRKEKKKKIYIISGIGVREYYAKFGYKKEKTYMAKEIKR